MRRRGIRVVGIGNCPFKSVRREYMMFSWTQSWETWLKTTFPGNQTLLVIELRTWLSKSAEQVLVSAKLKCPKGASGSKLSQALMFCFTQSGRNGRQVLGNGCARGAQKTEGKQLYNVSSVQTFYDLRRSRASRFISSNRETLLYGIRSFAHS